MAIGLLASTRLAVGEALRFDRADVDLSTGFFMSGRPKFARFAWSRSIRPRWPRCEGMRAHANHLSSTEVPAFFS